MTVLRAKLRRGAWRLTLHRRDGPTSYDEERLHAAVDRGRSRLRAFWEALGLDSGVWRLEYPKAAIGEGEMALGNADLFAEACAAATATTVELEAPDGWLNVRSTRQAFRDRGLPVAGQSAARMRDHALFLISALAAAAWLIAGIARHRRDGGRLNAPASSLFAVHGEWTNRTRHVLSLLRDGANPAAIIVLGRPRRALRQVREHWESALGLPLPPLRRPFSVSATFGAIPEALALLRLGQRTLTQCPYLPPLRQQVAIAYRILYGAVSATWWREQHVAPSTISYGHTGVADTTGLELAQQTRGAQTVHVVHGISSGINFTGCSTKAVFRCGHDARWHSALGGYGKCVATPAERPLYQQGRDGLALLTNLAHPMNPWFRLTGIQDETRVLEDVAVAAKRVLGDETTLVWKPHPITHQLPAATQETLARQASRLGYRQTPASTDTQVLAHQVHWVLCTVSTVVLDLLEQGFLPIMLIWQPLDPDAALSHYPVSARNRHELASMFQRLRDKEHRQALFEEAWSAIQPCPAVDVRHIDPHSSPL